MMRQNIEESLEMKERMEQERARNLLAKEASINAGLLKKGLSQ